MNNILITADLHFNTDPLDSYRFDIFNFIEYKLIEYNCKSLYILGDLTTNKDKHPSKLVNRLVKELLKLTKFVNEIVILRGNHDYKDENTPFFGFLSEIPKIKFINEITLYNNHLFVPHIDNIHDENKQIIQKLIQQNPKYVFMHGKVKNAILENGYKDETGLDINELFKNYNGTVISGDIHNPQVIGNLTYVGSPYHIHFGDIYDGRMLVLKEDGLHNIRVNSIRKLKIELTSNIDDIDNYTIKENDLLKVIFNLNRSELYLYDKLKQQLKKLCSEKNYYIHSIDFKIKDNVGVQNQISNIDKKGYDEVEILNEFLDKELKGTNIENWMKMELRNLGDLMLGREGFRFVDYNIEKE